MRFTSSAAPDVYPVGALADLRAIRNTLRHRRFRKTWQLLRYTIQHWRRRSYWNGYLAEVDGYSCGHGWTKRRAVRDLGRVIANTRTMRHQPCGAIGLTPSDRRAYCVICDVKDRRWIAYPSTEESR